MKKNKMKKLMIRIRMKIKQKKKNKNLKINTSTLNTFYLEVPFTLRMNIGITTIKKNK